MHGNYGMKNGIKRFSDFFIYKATQYDLASIMLLEWKLFGKDAWGFNTFEKYISSNKHSFPVIYYDNVLIGFGLSYLGTKKSPAHIYDLGIAKKFRGFGLGKKIINYLVGESIKIKTKSIKLEVAKNNINAKSLYDSLGFKEYALLKNYYGHNKHAVQMSLELENFQIKYID